MEERNREHHLSGYLTRIFPTVYSYDDVDDVDVPTKSLCIPDSYIFCTLCSILMHIVDIGLDYNIAIQYLLDDKITYFAWTICIIIIPSLINVIISRRMQYEKKEVKYKSIVLIVACLIKLYYSNTCYNRVKIILE